jgi:acyl-[acyl-carrier-protein] desaturase
MARDEKYELVEAVDSVVDRLIKEHQQRRSDWYFHEFVPWERGESFKEKPWDVSQCTISENARTSLVLNLLTEDNLPYYHALIEKYMPPTSAFSSWNHLWTAEEAQHAIAIRSYLLTSRNCDPYELEDDRKSTMINGYQPTFDDPTEIFAYTAAQELATRVSHRNAGKITDDPAAFELMRLIASDENHHFIFYKSVMQAMLDTQPSLVLADEPTANLDTANGEQAMEIMERLNAQTGTAFVFATHDPRVMAHARRVVRLLDGRVAVDEGLTAAIANGLVH